MNAVIVSWDQLLYSIVKEGSHLITITLRSFLLCHHRYGAAPPDAFSSAETNGNR